MKRWSWWRCAIGDIWAQMFPIEQHRIMRLLIERVQLHPNGLDIVWREDGWQRFRRELAQHPFVVEQKERPPWATSAMMRR